MNLKKVKTEWTTEVSYHLLVYCPNCNKILDEDDFDIEECDSYDGMVTCYHCRAKFILQVNGD